MGIDSSPRYWGGGYNLTNTQVWRAGPIAQLNLGRYEDGFGVDAEQSINSGLSEFDASGGVVYYRLHATVYVPVDQYWFLTGFASYNRIVGDAKESPLVEERGSVDLGIAGFLLGYSF